MPRPGEIWEDRFPPFKGRRGRVVQSDYMVTLDPHPGHCPCPKKQRRTAIRLDRFMARWQRIAPTRTGQEE